MVIAQDELAEPQIEFEDAVNGPDERECCLDRVVKARGFRSSDFGRIEGVSQTDQEFGALCELGVHEQPLIAPYCEAGIVADFRP
jgi:hypothetical protein